MDETALVKLLQKANQVLYTGIPVTSREPEHIAGAFALRAAAMPFVLAELQSSERLSDRR